MPSTIQERLADRSHICAIRARAPICSARSRCATSRPRRRGRVRLTLLLAEGDDPALAKEVREAVTRVDGVTDVELDVKPVASAPAVCAGRMLPVMDQAPAAPARPAAPTPKHFPNLGRVIAISSGKGGVGKSTVAVNLAVALAKSGARVGLMDADIYGPNIPRMMG
jgi:ATP-binding protein involved in chromosome partitioning